MSILEYLKQNTTYSPETCKILQDTIEEVSCANIPLTEKERILRGCMEDATFSDGEITTFAQNMVPEKFVTVPVDVSVVRGYRIYVKVPKGSDSDAVKKATKEEIINYGLEESELDPDLDIEEDDIRCIDVDWEGAYDEDE